jgi:UDP-glucose 4-epimerase
VRVLITGGCGFVGTNLIDLLNRHGGYEITVFDNETLGKRAFLAGLDCAFIRGDIRDSKLLHSATRGQDAVVHLAADTRVLPSIEQPRFNFDVNVIGSLNLLEAMRAAGVKRLVNASTGGAIMGEVIPPIHEEMVPRPISPYGASKLAVEGYCSAFSASFGLNAVSLRFSNVYGRRSFHKGSVVAQFLRNVLAGRPLTIYGDGSQTRDYVYVDDICEGILAGLRKDVSGVFQLGTGRPLSLNELIDAMRSVVAPRAIEVGYAHFRDAEVRYTYCDISKAREGLGYDPRTSIQDGLARTWEWFLEREQLGIC